MQFELGDMRRKSAYVDKEALTPEVRSALLEKQMLQSDTRSTADCIVVDDVTQPGMRNLWAAVLFGIPMLSKRVVMDSVGPMIQYQKAINTTRHIWVSPELRAMRPAVFKVLEKAGDRDGSKWAIIRGNFTKYQVAHRKKGNSARALVTKKQYKEHFLKLKFLNRPGRPNPTRSRFGCQFLGHCIPQERSHGHAAFDESTFLKKISVIVRHDSGMLRR